jgi:hypothetical protein
MIWFITFLLITAIGAFVGYLKYAKTEEDLYDSIKLGIRCAYIGLQVFLAIGGVTFLWIVGWWLVG